MNRNPLFLIVGIIAGFVLFTSFACGDTYYIVPEKIDVVSSPSKRPIDLVLVPEVSQVIIDVDCEGWRTHLSNNVKTLNVINGSGYWYKTQEKDHVEIIYLLAGMDQSIETITSSADRPAACGRSVHY